MTAKASEADLDFRDAFEAGQIAPDDFHHREHLRLAYAYLCECNLQDAYERVHAALKNFLKINSVPPEKYHATLTFAWLQAVNHFMAKAGDASSFEDFIAADNRLLKPEIMLTHYKKETLFSEQARTEITPPDIQEIP